MTPLRSKRTAKTEIPTPAELAFPGTKMGLPSILAPIVFGTRTPGAKVEIPTSDGIMATAAYPYRDTVGNLLFIKFRAIVGGEIKKGWKQAGYFAYDKVVHKDRLYCEILIKHAIERGVERAWLVEGEKDVETLVGLGEYAVSPQFGAKSLSAANLAKFEGFKGVVWVVMDDDDEGKLFAAAAIRHLSELGVQWNIVKSAEDKEHSDFTDHIDAGFEIDDLVWVSPGELGIQAPEQVRESVDMDAEGVPQSGFVSNFTFKRMEGTGYVCLCPAHKDNDPSLIITPSSDRWLVYCRAMCKTEDVLAAVGLKKSDMYYGGSAGGAGLSLDEMAEHAKTRIIANELGGRLAREELRRLDGLDFEDPSNKLWTPEDIADAQHKKIDWLIKGIWAQGSHGVIGGREKSLKSYLLDVILVGTALGKLVLGMYQAEQTAVYLMIGEGDPTDRFLRLRRIAKDVYQSSIKDADGFLYIRPRACPWDSTEFGRYMKESRDVGAQVVALDSVYNYQPPGLDVQNMYDRGAALTKLSQAVGLDRSLMLVDHFRKNGSADLDLASLAQAGMGPWVDSWVLVKHRLDALPHQGFFQMEMAAGSRRGYGKHLNLDWNLGEFDDELGAHAGQIQLTVSQHDGRTSATGSDEMSSQRIQDWILEQFAEATKPLAKTALKTAAKKSLKIGDDRFYEEFNSLVSAKFIINDPADVAKEKAHPRWILNTNRPKQPVLKNFGGK
ncbi:AAA family ATPase [Streptomyces sp. HNA39]|uniref:AAA family ATPase n=1 Tax=Streptomyces sp. HNA39 TaxID=2850561 RepID=UPI00200E9335|nr:AAA family ATPase [Streptomyces sp. HNA39]UQA37508.1 AAA family ATPase [Streptomyces sp. HNA39]